MKDSQQGAALWVRLAKCHMLVLNHVRHLPAASSLTLPQFDVLAQLLRHGRPLSVGDLSRMLLVTAGNVSGIVARLEGRKLIRSFGDPADRRIKLIQLTRKGQAVAAKEVKRQEDHLHGLFAALDKEDHEVLRAALDALRTAIEKRSAINGHSAQELFV